MPEHEHMALLTPDHHRPTRASLLCNDVELDHIDIDPDDPHGPELVERFFIDAMSAHITATEGEHHG
jgi:hypothetical protein